MAEETVTKMESSDTFEIAVRSVEPFPHDFREWPEHYRKISDEAVEKLLESHPGTKVVSDTSMSLDDTHPRYPVGLPKGMFYGVRTIKLDQPIEVEDPAGRTYSAVIHLRQFEDQHFGPDAVRIRDQIEKGSGSPFQMAKPEVRAQHQALEKLIEAEAKLAAAHTALIQADTEYEAARAATEPKADNPRLSRLGPTVEEYVAAGYRASNYPPGGYDSRSTREEIDAAIAKQEADAAASK